MPHDASRRRFLASLGEAGACLAAGSWLDGIGYAQAVAGPRGRSSSRAPRRGDFDRRLLGSFLEHLGRADLHGRLPSPGPALADASGFRTDVVARDQGARRADRAVSRRQFRLRLQLARRRRPEGPAARRCSSARGTRSRRTSSGPTSSSTGAALVGTEPLLGMNFGTGTVGDGGGLRRVLQRRARARSGATCAGRTATSSRTTCATGASATRWTARGRSGTCRRASTAGRRATRRSRCASSIRGCS